MSKLIIALLLAGFIVSNSDESKYADKSYEELLLEYEAPQRKENPQSEPGGIELESIRWYHLNESVGGRTYYYDPDKVKQTKRLPEELRDRSNAYIECDQKIADAKIYPFDFPLRGKSPEDKGWLYYVYGNIGTMRWFFDTGVSEHWVLPNVYCNSKNILSAVSWMKSHPEMSFRENKEMHARFRDSPTSPPLYGEKLLEDKSREGVYCGWQGWLYDSEHGKYTYYFDTSEKEKFTFINVYCRDHRARFFAKSVGGDLARKEDVGLLFPFGYRDEYASMVASADDDSLSIGCNWTGWLFSDVTKSWDDGGKRRQAYEKYFGVENTWMNGRVMNPFCSKEEDEPDGIVTALRVYCFYSKENRCSDLTPTPSQ